MRLTRWRKQRAWDQLFEFDSCDASKDLPCENGAFDAVFSNDAICHIPHRRKLLEETYRVLKPGGRMLFSDALVVGGMLSHEEIAVRSSIGYYVFSPPEKMKRSSELRGLSW